MRVLRVRAAFSHQRQFSAYGPVATLRTGKHTLRMTAEAPVGSRFAVELLDEACRINLRAGILKRLTFVLPAAAKTRACVKMEVL